MVNKEKFWIAFYSIITFILLYIGVACLWFAFQNPTLTETQRFLHIPDALLFRSIDD